MREWIKRRFGSLRWQLTWSYVWVSVAISTVLNLVVVAGLLAYQQPGSAQQLQAELREAALMLRPIYSEASRTAEIQLALRARFSGEAPVSGTVHTYQTNKLTPSQKYQLVFDNAAFMSGTTVPLSASHVLLALGREGETLGGTYPEQFAPGQPFADPQAPNAGELIAASLATGEEQSGPSSLSADYSVVIVPIRDEGGAVLGALYLRTSIQQEPRIAFLALLGALGVVSLVSTFVLNAVIGLIFGILVSRPLVGRLSGMERVATAFAAGDLSSRIEDGSHDELGQLGRQFDQMADQLEANVRALRQLADHNASLAEQAAELATLEERNRLARDLHDSVSQELFSVTMLAAAAQHTLDDKPEKAKEHLHQLVQMAQRALRETRALIFALRPAALGDQGLAPALRQLRDSARDRQGLQIDLQIQGERRIPLEHEQTLFRIVQEALANIVRHSGINQSQVELLYTDEATVLRVRDQGKGFDLQAPRSGHSLGLISIAERAEALGGSAEVASILGAGTSVTITIPRTNERKRHD